MHDHEGFILQRKPCRQEAQRLRIIDFDAPGRIEFYLPAGIGNGLERESRGEPVVLPLLVGKDANVEKALVGRLEVELQARLDRVLGRSQSGVIGIGISAKMRTRCGQRIDRKSLRTCKLIPPERAAEEPVDLRISGAALRSWRIKRAILIAGCRRRIEGRLRLACSWVGGGGRVVVSNYVVIDDEQGRRCRWLAALS